MLHASISCWWRSESSKCHKYEIDFQIFGCVLKLFEANFRSNFVSFHAWKLIRRFVVKLNPVLEILEKSFLGKQNRKDLKSPETRKNRSRLFPRRLRNPNAKVSNDEFQNVKGEPSLHCHKKASQMRQWSHLRVGSGWTFASLTHDLFEIFEDIFNSHWTFG